MCIHVIHVPIIVDITYLKEMRSGFPLPALLLRSLYISLDVFFKSFSTFLSSALLPSACKNYVDILKNILKLRVI